VIRAEQRRLIVKQMLAPGIQRVAKVIGAIDMFKNFLKASPAIIGLGTAAFADAANAACLSMNLQTGQHGSPVADISFVSPPKLAGGWYQAVLRLDFNDTTKVARFTISYPAAPTGFTVDIGDSSTNDAGGGDAGTQSNDAEAVITGTLPDDANYSPNALNIHGRDGVPSSDLARIGAFASKDSTVQVKVAHRLIEFSGGNVAGRLSSKWLYQLNGNPDGEGAVYNTIYASFNRVIGGAARSGTGVGKVEVCF
jgi:hypothetical protein